MWGEQRVQRLIINQVTLSVSTFNRLFPDTRKLIQILAHIYICL